MYHYVIIIIIIIIIINMDSAYCTEIMEASNLWNPKGLFIVNVFKNF
jgi:hypothetical protein